MGWRSGFLVAPVAALIALAIVLRFVPETPRAPRRLDVPGLVLVAAALLALVYGISRLQSGLHAGAFVPIVVGVVAAVAFVLRELHTPDPALDLRIFGSGRFNAAVTAGATFNFLTGGSTILFAFYLVTVRDESPALLGLLLVPATVLQAFAATGSGRAAASFGDRAVLVDRSAVAARRSADADRRRREHVDAGALRRGGAERRRRSGGADPAVDDHDGQRARRPRRLGVGGQVGRRPGRLFARARRCSRLVGTTLFTHDATRRLAGSGITSPRPARRCGPRTARRWRRPAASMSLTRNGPGKSSRARPMP